MRILACTDVHEPDGSYAGVHDKKGLYKSLLALKKQHKPDVLISCGDFGVFGAEQDKALNILGRLKLPTFLIHGNHDDYEDFDEFCNSHDHVHNLHANWIEHDGYLIFGWGGEGFGLKTPQFDRWAKKIEKVMKNYDKCIFLTHQPVYGTSMDIVWGDHHVGSKSFRKFVQKHSSKIVLVLSGHIHDGFLQTDKIKKTALINPGPRGIVVDLEH